jgi:acyl-CoA thioester hydrolase
MSDSHLIRVFEGETEMRWGDLDAYGHVNNVRFFDYFQEARIIWLTRAQVRMDDPQSGFVVVPHQL